MNTKQLQKFVKKSLEDNKAQKVTIIELGGKSDIADCMMVATGTSNRHVNAISENLVQDLRAAGIKSIDPEGMETGDWVLIDLFDIIVHVMQPEAREKYDLESMWQVTAEKKPKTKRMESTEPKNPAVKLEKAIKPKAAAKVKTKAAPKAKAAAKPKAAKKVAKK
jgi:ribosome-associated protein